MKKIISIIIFSILSVNLYSATLLASNSLIIKKKKKNITALKNIKKIKIPKISKPVVKTPVIVKKPSLTKPVGKKTIVNKPIVKLTGNNRKFILSTSKTPLLTKDLPKITKPLFKTGQKRFDSPIVLKSSLVKPITPKAKTAETKKTLIANNKPTKKTNTPIQTPRKINTPPKHVFVLPIPPVAKKIKIPAPLVRR